MAQRGLLSGGGGFPFLLKAGVMPSTASRGYNLPDGGTESSRKPIRPSPRQRRKPVGKVGMKNLVGET